MQTTTIKAVNTAYSTAVGPSYGNWYISVIAPRQMTKPSASRIAYSTGEGPSSLFRNCTACRTKRKFILSPQGVDPSYRACNHRGEREGTMAREANSSLPGYFLNYVSRLRPCQISGFRR